MDVYFLGGSGNMFISKSVLTALKIDDIGLFFLSCLPHQLQWSTKLLSSKIKKPNFSRIYQKKNPIV